jgi:hypothetical protein
MEARSALTWLLEPRRSWDFRGMELPGFIDYRGCIQRWGWHFASQAMPH